MAVTSRCTKISLLSVLLVAPVLVGGILADAARAQPRPGVEADDTPAIWKPSAQASSYCYNLGINHYIKRDYAQAYRAFSKAYDETSEYERLQTPRGTVIQYWRAAALIGMNQVAYAEAILRPIVESARRPLSVYSTGEVVRALERVQGPIRRTIQEIETQIICGCSSYSDVNLYPFSGSSCPPCQ